MSYDGNLLHHRSWKYPYIESISNEFDITFHVFASRLELLQLNIYIMSFGFIHPFSTDMEGDACYFIVTQ